MIIDAVSQPQAMKKMLEKDFGKVFGFVANASMLVRALKSMGAFKVKDVKFRCPPLCRGSYQQYTNNIREKSTLLPRNFRTSAQLIRRHTDMIPVFRRL